MSGLTKILLYFIASVAFAVLIAPLVIKLMSKLKAKQTVLGYVKQHEHKSGTPTMGGFIFLLPALVFSLVEFQRFSLVAIAVTTGFCVLGFLDDFIKIRYSRNLGLKPYQKIIGQLGLSFAAGWFVYASKDIGTAINLPFTTYTLDMSWGIIPFVVLVYVATTNSVNLTDGLDGLAGYTSVAYFFVVRHTFIFHIRRRIEVGRFRLCKRDSISLRILRIDARRRSRLSRIQRLSRKDNDGGYGVACARSGVRHGSDFFKKSAFNRHVGHNVRVFKHISYIAGAVLQTHEEEDLSYGSLSSSS